MSAESEPRHLQDPGTTEPQEQEIIPAVNDLPSEQFIDPVTAMPDQIYVKQLPRIDVDSQNGYKGTSAPSSEGNVLSDLRVDNNTTDSDLSGTPQSDISSECELPPDTLVPIEGPHLLTSQLIFPAPNEDKLQSETNRDSQDESPDAVRISSVPERIIYPFTMTIKQTLRQFIFANPRFTIADLVTAVGEDDLPEAKAHQKAAFRLSSLRKELLAEGLILGYLDDDNTYTLSDPRSSQDRIVTRPKGRKRKDRWALSPLVEKAESYLLEHPNTSTLEIADALWGEGLSKKVAKFRTENVIYQLRQKGRSVIRDKKSGGYTLLIPTVVAPEPDASRHIQPDQTVVLTQEVNPSSEYQKNKGLHAQKVKTDTVMKAPREVKITLPRDDIFVPEMYDPSAVKPEIRNIIQRSIARVILTHIRGGIIIEVDGREEVDDTVKISHDGKIGSLGRSIVQIVQSQTEGYSDPQSLFTRDTEDPEKEIFYEMMHYIHSIWTAQKPVTELTHDDRLLYAICAQIVKKGNDLTQTQRLLENHFFPTEVRVPRKKKKNN